MTPPPAPTDTPTAPPPTATPTPTALPPTATPTAAPTATSSPTPIPTSTPLPTPQPPPYDDRSGPTRLLASYVDAINRRDYARAWGTWESPPNPSYEDFVQGFADTASVRLAVRPPTWFEGAAGSTYASMPTMLMATHVDGSRHNLVGCYVARRPNLGQPEDERVWSLFDATVEPAPGNATDALLLADACPSTPRTAYEDRSGAVPVLASYVNAINLEDYARAWDYWETPPAESFEAFEEGFADTASVMLVVRPPTRFEGAAGSTYVAIPTLLSALHTDGSRHNFVACYVGRRPNLGGPGVEKVWSLYDATVEPAPGNASDAMLLDDACADW